MVSQKKYAVALCLPKSWAHGADRAFVNFRFSSASLRRYTLQSPAPKGGQVDKNHPIRPPEGAKADIVNEDEDGYTVVTPRGKTRWVDRERVRTYRMTEIQIRTSAEGGASALGTSDPKGCRLIGVSPEVAASGQNGAFDSNRPWS
jgi:hypothetical protein